jgi:hypothetical protein
VVPAGDIARSARPYSHPEPRTQHLLSACLDGVAAAALAIAPLWWHVSLFEPDIPDLTAVFTTIAVFPADVCLALVAVGGLVPLLIHPCRRAWCLRGLALGVSAVPVASLLSMWQASEPLLAAAVAAQLALLGLAWFGAAIGGVSAHWLALGIVASGSAQAALAIGQFVSQRPLVPVALDLPWLPSADVTLSGAPVVLDPAGDRLLRAFGTFPHPNILGGYLALALVLLPVLNARRWLVWPLGVLLGGGLLVSFSRAAWLATALGVAMLLMRPNPRGVALRWLVAGFGVAILALALSPLGVLVSGRLAPQPANDLERGSIEQRLALDRLALVEIRRHPLLGVGAGNFGLATLEEGLQSVFGEPAHSVPLLVVAELGLPGAAAGLLLVGAIADLARRDPIATRPALAACVTIGVLMLLDHYTWTMPPGRVLAWVPLAVLAAARTRMAPFA